jgi:hypothetical protein
VPKIIIAAIVFLIGLASMGMVGLNDSIKRPAYCAYCHADPHYASWEGSDYLATTHARAALPCQTCHPRGLGRSLEEIVSQIKGDYRLRRLRVSNEACLRCHAHSNYPDLITRTKHIKLSPHVPYHWKDMDCRICHKMHKPSEDYCSECHDPSASRPGWIIKEKRKGKLPVPRRPPS